MADNGFNGSTVTLDNTNLGTLRGISYSNNPAKVRTSGASAARHTYVTGVDDIEVVVDLVGFPTSVVTGSSGTLVVSWNSGDNEGSLGDAVVTGITANGAMDGEITSQVTLAPA
ncbi:MAG: hypothetical protein ACOY3P_03585 [Planctomycetota bacterium]